MKNRQKRIIPKWKDNKMHLLNSDISYLTKFLSNLAGGEFGFNLNIGSCWYKKLFCHNKIQYL